MLNLWGILGSRSRFGGPGRLLRFLILDGGQQPEIVACRLAMLAAHGGRPCSRRDAGLELVEEVLLGPQSFGALPRGGPRRFRVAFLARLLARAKPKPLDPQAAQAFW